MQWQLIVQRWWRASMPWLSVVLLVALIVVPVGLFIWMVFSTDLFRVQAVTILDGRDTTTAQAQTLIEEELQHVPLHRTIFFVQPEVIQDRLLASLPQLRTVRVERKLPATLRVLLQEKTPVLLLLSKGSYYFVDETGVPYEKAELSTLPGVALPTVKNADKEATVTLGAPALAPDFVAFLQYVTAHLKDAVPANIAEIRIPSLAAREVHVILDTNWVIKFDVTRDPAAQLTILGRIIKEMLSPEEQGKLEYIDLRIPNRIYYKTK